MQSYGADVDLYPKATWEVEAAAMDRFLDAVDERYGGARRLLVDHGVPSAVIDELTEVLVEHPVRSQAQRGVTVNVTETIVIAASPDTVWKVVGDVGAIAGWAPAIESCRMEGDVRHATFAGGGGEAAERIVEHDDAARAYSYAYLSGPLPLEVYLSRLSVQDHSEGAEVVWASEFTAATPEVESQLAAAIADIYRNSLEELKKQVES
jgi:hypothetical protein